MRSTIFFILLCDCDRRDNFFYLPSNGCLLWHWERMEHVLSLCSQADKHVYLVGVFFPLHVERRVTWPAGGRGLRTHTLFSLCCRWFSMWIQTFLSPFYTVCIQIISETVDTKRRFWQYLQQQWLCCSGLFLSQHLIFTLMGFYKNFNFCLHS